MRIESEAFPDYFLVQRIWANRKDAYRKKKDGSWEHSIGEKGPLPWVRVNAIYVPAEVLAAYADYLRATDPVRQDPCNDFLGGGGFRVCRRCGREGKDHG